MWSRVYILVGVVRDCFLLNSDDASKYELTVPSKAHINLLERLFVCSCGIPDYRSGMDTVLKTGPGVWELAAREEQRSKGASVTPIINALPSPTHMAILQLHKEGMVKYTISQNIDGLHCRSGLKRTQLAELHGNTNLETCEKCKRQYLRDFETRLVSGRG